MNALHLQKINHGKSEQEFRQTSREVQTFKIEGSCNFLFKEKVNALKTEGKGEF